eukprot:1160804-Pelagomonas_calceolata.AAC.5
MHAAGPGLRSLFISHTSNILEIYLTKQLGYLPVMKSVRGSMKNSKAEAMSAGSAAPNETVDAKIMFKDDRHAKCQQRKCSAVDAIQDRCICFEVSAGRDSSRVIPSVCLVLCKTEEKHAQ